MTIPDQIGHDLSFNQVPCEIEIRCSGRSAKTLDGLQLSPYHRLKVMKSNFEQVYKLVRDDLDFKLNSYDDTTETIRMEGLESDVPKLRARIESVEQRFRIIAHRTCESDSGWLVSVRIDDFGL